VIDETELMLNRRVSPAATEVVQPLNVESFAFVADVIVGGVELVILSAMVGG
jgi:hypothetical protein